MIIKKRNEPIKEKKTSETPVVETVAQEKVDLFELDNIEFSQRQERRRGNRRRGYRRIDDRNLISRAQEEAGTIRDNAAQEGYKSGIESAKKDIEQLKVSLGNFMTSKNEMFEFIAPNILEISLDIARKIIKKEISQNPDVILETILDVLKTISKEEPKVTLKVNPAQIEITKENILSLKDSIGLDAKTNVIADDTIEIGGCIIQTSNGIVDATLDTQLEIIKEAFKGM